MKNILIVDDEKQILRAFKRLFLQTDYKVFYAENGIEALNILKTEKINLMITDIRMPEVDGYELLKQVKQKYPNVIRLALSGYDDKDKVLHAVEKGVVKLYLLKPWENDQILKLLDKIFKVEEILKDKKLLKMVNDLDKLPTLPKLYQDLCNLINKNASIDEITEIIEMDPPISSRILKISNSVYCGFKTGSVKKSVAYLGLTLVKHIVLNNGVFNDCSIEPRIKELLWKHSSLTNELVLIFYERLLNKKVPDLYESAGLLHDIGRIILMENFKEKYNLVLKETKSSKQETVTDIEKRIIGISTQEIGGYLLNWWELPYPIVESALFNHIPLDDRVVNKELVCVVNIANYYAWTILDNKNIFIRQINDNVFNYVNISKKMCEQLIDEVINELNI